jgi:hypothetical protein
MENGLEPTEGHGWLVNLYERRSSIRIRSCIPHRKRVRTLAFGLNLKLISKIFSRIDCPIVPCPIKDFLRENSGIRTHRRAR